MTVLNKKIIRFTHNFLNLLILFQWCSPEEMLEDNSTNSIFLAPPQVYELSRMIPIQSYHELRDFAKKRETQGCERWMPIISTALDGAISYLPGRFFNL